MLCFYTIQLQQQVTLVDVCLHHVHLHGHGVGIHHVHEELQSLTRELCVQFDEIGQVVEDVDVHGGNTKGFGLRDVFNSLQVDLGKENLVRQMDIQSAIMEGKISIELCTKENKVYLHYFNDAHTPKNYCRYFDGISLLTIFCAPPYKNKGHVLIILMCS